VQQLALDMHLVLTGRSGMIRLDSSGIDLFLWRFSLTDFDSRYSTRGSFVWLNLNSVAAGYT
jgi:hypothetical protein